MPNISGVKNICCDKQKWTTGYYDFLDTIKSIGHFA